MDKIYKNFKKKSTFYLAIITLIFIPFLWLNPGEMDLGGDTTRLYFYDPLSYIQNYSLFAIHPIGTGRVEINFSTLPIATVFFILKSIIGSSYLLITLFNSFKLIVSFVAIYAIVKELIGKIDKENYWKIEVTSVLSGLFYIFSRGMTNQWNLAYLTHDQFFLNPLIFYLILKYFITHKIIFLWFTLLITFVFSHNFSWSAAPPFFAFYPLAILFLVVYTLFIRKIKLPLKGIFFGFFIFFGIHAFHILPTLKTLLDSESNINSRVFDKEVILQQLDYFFGVLPNASLSKNILLPSLNESIPILSISFFIILFGLVLGKTKKTILLTGIFFLITLYLLSAKVGNSGVKFYVLLFKYFPAFSMFRNFIHQWIFSFSFFYTLLFGQLLFIFFLKLRKKTFFGLSLVILFILVFNSWDFINGSLVKRELYQSPNLKNSIIMDSNYEQTIKYIKSLPYDAKILTLPFSDYNYQVIKGLNQGAYDGMSSIPFLTGKKDFPGYATIAPFSEAFINLAKEKDYLSFSRVLGILNVQYIFHNSDYKIYDKTFPLFPYEYMRKYFPNSQKEYTLFIDELGYDKIFENSKYKLFSLTSKYLLPHIYTTNSFLVYKNDEKLHPYYASASSFFPLAEVNDPRISYIEKESCNKVFKKKLCNLGEIKNIGTIPKIYFKKINPTKYKVKISSGQNPFVLVFSEAFNPNWKAYIVNVNSKAGEKIKSYFNGQVEEGKHKNNFIDKNVFETLNKKSIKENNHFQINGYANAWYISPLETGGIVDYEIIIEMSHQRTFYIGFLISFIFITGFSLWGFILFLLKK